MTKGVHFGSNESYGLVQAILVYSDGQKMFATLHQAKESPDGGPPYLDAGQPIHVEFLKALAEGLGQTVAREVLPANVLVRTPDVLVWWVEQQYRVMFYNHTTDGRTLNGKRFPQPPLVFKVCVRNCRCGPWQRTNAQLRIRSSWLHRTGIATVAKDGYAREACERPTGCV